jgi:alkaline phosphatase D
MLASVAGMALLAGSLQAQNQRSAPLSAEALAADAAKELAAYKASQPAPSAHLPIREPQPDALLTTIAFGSCARENRPQPIWERVLEYRPDLFLFLGDNAYLDTTRGEVMARKYAQAAAHPGFEELAHKSAIMATWDDHDFGVNDGGRTFSHKALAREAFLDFWQVPADDPRRAPDRAAPQGGGIHHARIIGPPGKRVQVILLDTRWNRDDIPTTRVVRSNNRTRTEYLPNTDPNSTLLGEPQWKWLEEQLRQPAEIRLLCSSIQVVSEEHPFEKWANFPHERTRLLNLIRETSASGVLILSGDRHLADLSVLEAGVGYPIFDFTSSGLTQGHRFFRFPERNRHRLAGMPSGNHFGLIRIDWRGQDTTIRLDCIDEAGDTAFGLTIPLHLLQFGAEEETAKYKW